MNASSAGKGDAYWYEWTVGQHWIAKMLSPDSNIQNVSLQVRGIKGWDDVVVRYTDGRRELIQINYSH